MLTDFTKSCRDLIIGRTTSPLFGAFATSWLVWNYRTILVIFSDGDYAKKIEFIQTRLYPTPHEAYSYALAGPLFTAIVILLVYPFPARWAFDFTHKKHMALLESRDKIEGLKPISEKEALELRKKILSKEREYSETIKDKEDQIETLTALVRDLRESIKKPNDAYDQRIAALTEQIERERTENNQLKIKISGLEHPQSMILSSDEINILRAICEKGGSEMEYHSLNRAAKSGALIVFQHYIDKMTGHGLIQVAPHPDSANHKIVELTAFGRSYVVQNNLLPTKST